ncbi:MAG: type II toxin-antitoxin system VapC family toxin [Verrucomicrobiales bacterium]|nr:type II toxin-antitoxin system VapC family toxin [Verrucomicrobiales bacterium]
MIYLDTCYILKCYLTENGSEEVRRLTQSSNGLASCAIARMEFAAAVHRHQREGKLSKTNAAHVLDCFQQDEQAGLWHWYGLTQNLLNEVFTRFQSMDTGLFVRTNDALHLTCAFQQGFESIHSNDRHLLAAATAFSLKGIDVIP